MLHVFEISLHDLVGNRRPGSIFDKCYCSFLEISFLQLIDKIAHEREYLGIIRRGSQYQLVVSESIFDRFCHIASCKIVDRSHRHTFTFKL